MGCQVTCPEFPSWCPQTQACSDRSPSPRHPPAALPWSPRQSGRTGSSRVTEQPPHLRGFDRKALFLAYASCPQQAGWGALICVLLRRAGPREALSPRLPTADVRNHSRGGGPLECLTQEPCPAPRGNRGAPLCSGKAEHWTCSGSTTSPALLGAEEDGSARMDTREERCPEGMGPSREGEEACLFTLGLQLEAVGINYSVLPVSSAVKDSPPNALTL